jgi:hypothetical protein
LFPFFSLRLFLSSHYYLPSAICHQSSVLTLRPSRRVLSVTRPLWSWDLLWDRVRCMASSYFSIQLL